MAKAVRFDRYGGSDVLYVADVDIPTPADDNSFLGNIARRIALSPLSTVDSE